MKTILLLLCLSLCGCVGLPPNRGGLIEATVDGVPLRIVQPENPKAPATVQIRRSEGKDGGRTVSVTLNTGASQNDPTRALRAFGGWRLAGGLVFVLGMVLLGWRAIPNMAALALCGSGLGLGTLSYIIPTYGTAIALVGLLGALLALLLWWQGLRTDPHSHPDVANDKVLKRFLKNL